MCDDMRMAARLVFVFSLDALLLLLLLLRLAMDLRLPGTFFAEHRCRHLMECAPHASRNDEISFEDGS